MATFADGESGLSVRTKINNVLQHADGTAGELVINDLGADVDFRVESDTNANALFVDGTTGNVGLGTSTPATGYKLDVNGQITISASAAAKLAWGYSGQYLSWIECGGVAGDNYMRFAAANAEAVRITNLGNVGIGTTTPGVKLDVSGAGRFSTRVTSPEFYGSTTGITQYMDSLGTTGMYVTGAGASPSNSIRLFSAGALFATFNSSGNMGLGVTPSAWGSAWRAAQIGAYGAFAAHVSVGAVRINSNAFDDGAEKYIGSTFATKYEQYEGNHRFFTAPSGTAGAAITFTNAMTLDASGNLGVGTTNPGAKVEVSQASSATSTGISPCVGLSLRNSTSTDGNYTSIQNRDASGDQNAEIKFINVSQSGIQGAIAFSTRASVGVFPEKMRITSTGQVGIGTVSPNGSAILDVQSTTLGVRFPNMTTTQKNAISNAAGNVIFDTDLGKLCVNTGSGWQTITSA